MNKLEKDSKLLKKKGKKVFVPFLVIGDPDEETFFQIIQVIEPFADIIELGIPYTDPVADGPVIQSADARAFSAGMDFAMACKLIKKVREHTAKPIVILTYCNVIGIEENRKESTLSRLAKAGVNGIIIADMPIEESHMYLPTVKQYGMDLIFLVAPTTTPSRLNEISNKATGFLYLVALKGVTGARSHLLKDTSELITRVKEINVDVPAYVGFGISKPEHVEGILGSGADGVIVGSAIIKKIEENIQNKTKMLDEIQKFVKSLKNATMLKKGD